MIRNSNLQAFLDASAAALRESATGDAALAAGRVMDRWGNSVGVSGEAVARLPVCDWIARALASVPGPRQGLATAFAAIEARLEWKRRASSSPDDPVFWNGHANAMILGPGGLEGRDDLWVGATVMAPHVRYADHSHPPEEVYVSLTPGRWWNSDMDWTDPGPNRVIYNPPGIVHAMQSGNEPFLALWYLPL